MKLKQIFSILCVFSLTAMFALGCGNSKGTENTTTQGEKEITYLFAFSTNTLNPHIEKSYIPLRAGIAETLVKIDEDLQLKPWLLESYNSNDGKHWEFKVRKGITFQNGTALDAVIVKANIEEVIKKNPGIKNVLNIESMEVDGQNLKIVTKKPNLSFPSEFVHPNTAIIDINAPDADTKPIGTGPFAVESFTSNVEVKMKKNDNYWDGKVKLDKVNFKFSEDANARLQALQSGTADIIFKPSSESVDALKKDSNITVDSVPGLRAHEIIYNMNRPGMGNMNFRKALDSLIDRQEIVDTIMMGQGTTAYGPFLDKFPFAINYEKNQFGLENALASLKNAGLEVEDGKVTLERKPLKLKIATYATRPELPQIAQVLQSNAKKIGIQMEIYVADNIDEYIGKSNDWDIAIYSLLTAPRGDVSYFLNAAFASEGSLNHGHINDSNLNEAIKQFNESTDEKTRNNLAQKAVKIINKENYNSFLVNPNITVAYNNKKVTGWVTALSEYYMITKDLDVK